MEEIKFIEKIQDFEGVYEKVENIFDEVMRLYSLSEKIEKNGFDDREEIPPVAKYLVYNGEDLLKVSYPNYLIDNNYLLLDLQLFGNDSFRLEEIRNEIVKGLESLL